MPAFDLDGWPCLLPMASEIVHRVIVAVRVRVQPPLYGVLPQHPAPCTVIEPGLGKILADDGIMPVAGKPQGKK